MRQDKSRTIIRIQVADLKRRLARKERSSQSMCEQVNELKLEIKNLLEKESKLKYEWTVRFTKLSNESRDQLAKAKADADARAAAAEASHREKLQACNKKLKAALVKKRATVATSPHCPV